MDGKWSSLKDIFIQTGIKTRICKDPEDPKSVLSVIEGARDSWQWANYIASARNEPVYVTTNWYIGEKVGMCIDPFVGATQRKYPHGFPILRVYPDDTYRISQPLRESVNYFSSVEDFIKHLGVVRKHSTKYIAWRDKHTQIGWVPSHYYFWKNNNIKANFNSAPATTGYPHILQPGWHINADSAAFSQMFYGGERLQVMLYKREDIQNFALPEVARTYVSGMNIYREALDWAFEHQPGRRFSDYIHIASLMGEIQV